MGLMIDSYEAVVGRVEGLLRRREPGVIPSGKATLARLATKKPTTIVLTESETAQLRKIQRSADQEVSA